MKSTIWNSMILSLAFFPIGGSWSVSAQDTADSQNWTAVVKVAIATDTLGKSIEPASKSQNETQVKTPQDDRWRKTVHGWEWLEAERPAPAFLQLHPLLVAAFQLLVAIFVWQMASESQVRKLSTEPPRHQ